MKRVLMIAALAATMLISGNVHARHSHDSDRDWKNTHSYQKQHWKKHRKWRHHHRRWDSPRYRYWNGYRTWYRGDDGRWGIVLRYFD